MKFAGFTPDQKFTLLGKLGYQGPKDDKMMEDFIASTPSAASKMSDYAKIAQDRLTKKFATGGSVLNNIYPTSAGNSSTKTPTTPETPKELTPEQKTQVDTAAGKTQTETAANLQTNLNSAQAKVAELQKMAQANPADQAILQALTKAQQELSVSQTNFNTAGVQSGGEMISQVQQNPASLITQTQTSGVAQNPDQILSQDVGKVSETAPKANTSTVTETATATAPEKIEANTYDPTKVSDQINKVVEDTKAATATASKAATVQGQLEGLMAQFEEGTPPWASGAMRAAMSTMASRGLGASSMAGQAIVQAAMESAIGIATTDAQINAQFELKNLDNEQQTLIFKTQQRISGLLSDQAAENAALQFNAASKTQTDQFFAGLQESVARFNADQINAVRQFNAGQENATEQFNVAMENQRQQFNAQNSLVIAQANAKWRQDIATLEAAAKNEAYMQDAKNATGMTQLALDELWQRERDYLSYAFTQTENEKDRNVQIALGNKNLEAINKQIDAQDNAAKAALIFNLASDAFGF